MTTSPSNNPAQDPSEPGSFDTKASGEVSSESNLQRVKPSTLWDPPPVAHVFTTPNSENKKPGTPVDDYLIRFKPIKQGLRHLHGQAKLTIRSLGPLFLSHLQRDEHHAIINTNDPHYVLLQHIRPSVAAFYNAYQLAMDRYSVILQTLRLAWEENQPSFLPPTPKNHYCFSPAMMKEKAKHDYTLQRSWHQFRTGLELPYMGIPEVTISPAPDYASTCMVFTNIAAIKPRHSTYTYLKHHLIAQHMHTLIRLVQRLYLHQAAIKHLYHHLCFITYDPQTPVFAFEQFLETRGLYDRSWDYSNVDFTPTDASRYVEFTDQLGTVVSEFTLAYHNYTAAISKLIVHIVGLEEDYRHYARASSRWDEICDDDPTFYGDSYITPQLNKQLAKTCSGTYTIEANTVIQDTIAGKDTSASKNTTGDRTRAIHDHRTLYYRIYLSEQHLQHLWSYRMDITLSMMPLTHALNPKGDKLYHEGLMIPSTGGFYQHHLTRLFTKFTTAFDHLLTRYHHILSHTVHLAHTLETLSLTVTETPSHLDNDNNNEDNDASSEGNDI